MRKILIHEAELIFVLCLCLLFQLPAWSVPAGGVGSANLEIIPNGLVVNGNVGIGTTAPGGKLDIGGKTTFEASGGMRTTGKVTAEAFYKTDGTQMGAGTVTNVAAGTGLTGGPITANGTIALADTTVTAGDYGSENQVGKFTVDAQGRLTAASNITITGFEPTFTTLGVSKGGTGATSFTANQLVRVHSGGLSLESSGMTLPTGAIVGTTDTQTLTNKTLNGTNTISAEAIMTGTLPAGRLIGAYTGITSVGVLSNLTVADPNVVAITALRNDGGNKPRLIMGVQSNEAYIHENYSTSSVPLNFKMGNSTVMTFAGTYVGIGTTAPGAKLHVAGTGSFEGITLGGVTQTSWPSGGGWTENATNNKIYTTNTGRNVGIGTAAPSAELDVRGNLVLDPGSSPAIYTGTAGSELNRYLQLINSPSQTSASGLKAGGILVADTYSYANPGKNNLIVKGMVRVGIGTLEAGTAKLAVMDGNVGIGTTEAGTAKLAVMGGNVGIGTTAPAGKLHVDMDGAGGTTWEVVFKDGKVGIGTTNPGEELEVAGSFEGVEVASSLPGILMRDKDSTFGQAAAYVGFYDQTRRTGFVGDGSGSLQSLDLWGDAGTFVRIGANNLEKMRITTDGKVGIGTTDPSAKLDVEGVNPIGYTARIYNSAGDPNGILLVKGGYYNSGDNDPVFEVANNQNNTILYANERNVGIGTTEPMGKLHVYVGALTPNAFVVNPADGKVGINSSPGDARLSVGGDMVVSGLPAGTGSAVYVDGFGKLYKASSSLRYKKDISLLTVDPQTVLQLSPKNFTWKENNARDIGLIAEEVDKVIPELVFYKDGQPEGVKYEKVPLYLLEVIKAQQKEIDELKADVDELKRK